MNRGGYYGDFDSFADEQRAYNEEQQRQAEDEAGAEQAQNEAEANQCKHPKQMVTLVGPSKLGLLECHACGLKGKQLIKELKHHCTKCGDIIKSNEDSLCANCI